MAKTSSADRRRYWREVVERQRTSQGARCADRAHLLRMVPCKRAFARLCLCNRNAGLPHEFVECL